jgi:hypothetical protein
MDNNVADVADFPARNAIRGGLLEERFFLGNSY